MFGILLTLVLKFAVENPIWKIKENQNGLSLCRMLRTEEYRELTEIFVPKKEAITEVLYKI